MPPKKSKSRKLTADGRKKRPPRLYLDSEQELLYINVDKQRIYFPDGTSKKQAMAKIMKSVRTVPRASKRTGIVDFSSPSTVSYIHLQPSMKEIIARVAQDRRLHRKYTARNKHDEAIESRKEKERLSKEVLRTKKKLLNEYNKVLSGETDEVSPEAVDEMERILGFHVINIPQVRQPASRTERKWREDHPEEAGEEDINKDIDAQLDEDLKHQQEKKDKDMSGMGKLATQVKRDGLYSDQIDEMMSGYKSKGYLGCIAADEIPELIKPSLKFDKVGWIMNKDVEALPGSHWVGVYVDFVDDCAIEYSDSFGEDPDERFFTDIKAFVDAHKPQFYLKMKINRVVKQRENSSTCGLMAIRFLLDRFEGKTFVDSTGWNDVTKGEAAANTLLKKADRFGYI